MFSHKTKRSAVFATTVRALRGALKAVFEWAWRKKLRLLILFVLIAGVFAMLNHFSTLNNASVVISFNYEQAAKGLNPNETRFNISELKQTDVMTHAIAYAGLSGQLTPTQLAACISISPTNTSGKSSAYIVTSYTIKYTNKYGIKNRSASDMLSLVIKAYKDFFIANYAQNQYILKLSMNDSQSEYILVLDLLRIRANQLKNYVETRLDSIKNYSDPVTGLSFSAINEELANFIEYDIAGLEAYITENGLAKDKFMVVSLLEYKKMLNQLSYDKRMAEYNVMNEGIKMYDKAMSSIVMIPTVDQSNQYYMSRTKTQMDELAKSASTALRIATATNSVIINDQYLSNKFTSSCNTTEQHVKANQMIAAMWAKLDSLSETLNTLDTAYLHYSTKDYMTVESKGLTFRSSLQLSSACTKAVLIMGVLVFLKFLLILRKQIKGAVRRYEEI